MESLPQLTEEEFDQIEEAVARTAKGRAFLRRYHRRAMGASAEEVRKMLQEFRDSWSSHDSDLQAARHVDVLRRELLEMAASIETARREVAALRPSDGQSDKIITATSELDAIVISTERASFEILNAAERLLELSGKLRASGADADACNDIDNEVNNIFTACSFQDLTGQRTSKVVNALRYIEQRINAMMSIWGQEGLKGIAVKDEITDTRPDAHLLNGPQLDGLGVSQADVDSMFGGPAIVTPPPPAAPSGPASQADIDSMFDSPAPAAPSGPASQSDIDSMFDSPAPAAKPEPPKPEKPPMPAKPAKPAAKAEEAVPAPLDQSAIDALFG